MYLSRVEIDTQNQNILRELTHLGAYHHWVESLFPNETKQQTRKLWRIDNLNQKSYLIVLSPNEPDQNTLEKYGVRGTAKIVNYDQFLAKLKTGMTARFKLLVNPTYSKSTGKQSGMRGKRLDCLSYDSQISYLEKRAKINGFSLIEPEYTVTNVEANRLHKKGLKRTVVRQVCFEGRLTIEDLDQFKQMLCEGMGQKKAYGCGLMTIIPE